MAEERIVTPRAPIHKHRTLLGRVAPRRRYGRRSAAPAGARDRDRSRRPARPGRAAATVLVVGLLLLGAAPAEAQTPRILVSNSSQGSDDSADTNGNEHAQLFHTGGHMNGYRLTSVAVNSEDLQNDDFDVEICEADTTANEFPTSPCTALTTMRGFTAGLVEFTHAGIGLSANTNYVVVIKQIGNGSVKLNSTTSGGEDSAGLSGWSIKDKFYWNDNGTWKNPGGQNEALRIVVYGYEETSPPAEPAGVNLQAENSAPGSVALGWDPLSANPQVQKFQLRFYRSTDSPSLLIWKDIPDSDHSTTRYTVTGLDHGTEYFFEVRAVNAVGSGIPGLAIVETLAPSTSAPSGFTATGGFRKLDLSWTASTVPVDRYQYRLSTDGGDSWNLWTDIPGSDHNTASHTVTGLPDATAYTVELRIRADEVRSAAARTTATTDTLPSGYKGAPGAPADLRVTLSHSCHVDLYWSAPASNGGKAITKYEQRTRKGNGSFGPWQTDLGNPLITYVTLGTLACDDYAFEVRAVNANGAGPRASIAFTSVDEGPPNEPVELAAVGGFRRVALSWEPPRATFTRIDYYQVRYRSGEQPYTSWARIPNSNDRTTSHTVTGLADETRYTIQVRAVNSEGGGASAQRGATTQALPVDAPSGFGVTAGIRKVDLAWTAAAATVAVEAYQYRLSTDGGDTWNPWTDISGSDATTTRHTVSRLANGTGYTVALRIRSGTARSAAASQSATTPDVPSAPELRARPGDRRSITLTWTKRYDGGRAITKYQYRRTRGSPGFTLWATIPGSGANTTGYTHSDGLSDEGRKYTFEVRAVNAVGNGRARRVDGRTAVSGAPTIRVWIALARESRNAAVDFTVELHPAASSTVTVDYHTEDRSATAPEDYQATAGTLTFALGETEKTVSVPIVDDTVEDSGESFALLLSNVSGARLGVERAAGLIYNTEDVIAGFTLVDAASGTDVGSLTDGTEVTLDAPATGQYGVRVETIPAAAIGSLRLALSGAKTVTRTDNAAPYTLYAEGGEGLPPGAYTLQATAYPDPDGGGTALQTRSVSFTVAAATADEDDGAALSASFPASRFASTRHTGSDDRPQVVVTFSETVATFAANTPSVQVTGGTIRSVQAHTEDGLAHAWLFFLTPDGDGDVTFTLVADAACASGGLCTAGGTVLTEVPATLTIPGPEAAADDEASLTASFGEVPAEHDGQSAFTVRVEFSEDVGISYKALRDESFSVTDGDVTGARRVDGRHDLWEITVEPESREAVTISLPGGRACGPAGAVCTRGDDPRPLSNSPSATVAGPAEDPAVTNTAATGAPTISGTAQVDETLTASVSGISDADGLDNASYEYQWIRGNTDIQDATDSSYTLVSVDEGETITVRVTFSDDKGHEESLTSAATDAVAPAPAPLTATFTDVPAQHAGAGETFTFGLTFSEHVAGLSYKTLRDAAFSVTNGQVTRARRQTPGSNQGWTITVEPDSHAALTVTLPAGSVETSDGRGLESAVSATVAGPVGIAVADAQVEEAVGAVLAFVVTLDRAASGTVTVDYATADGTATAGADYTATSGTLRFAAGETSTTVSVTVLDDAHDDGGETVTLTLSNPSGGRLTDGQATGTIKNRDPLPRALLARFGRTAAVHVVEHVEERIAAPRAPGVEGRFAGRALRPGMAREMALSFLNRLGGSAGAHPLGGGARGPLGGLPAGGMGSHGTPGLAADTPMAAAAGRWVPCRGSVPRRVRWARPGRPSGSTAADSSRWASGAGIC